MKLLSTYIFLLLLFVSCTTQDEIPESLTEKNKWLTANIDDYQITQQVSCYCMEEVTLPKVVVVRNGSIESVNGNSLTENDFNVKTINDFFNYIEDRIAEDPVVSEISYDPTYGFPNSIYFDMDDRIADEEIGFTLTDFIILN